MVFVGVRHVEKWAEMGSGQRMEEHDSELQMLIVYLGKYINWYDYNVASGRKWEL